MRQNKGPFAGLHSSSDIDGLLVFGVQAERHRDDAAAEEVENCLLPCWGQPQNLTDRFDARLLLDESALLSFQQHRRSGREAVQEPDGASAEKLDLERYRDLDYSRKHELQLHGRALSAPTYTDSQERAAEEEEEDCGYEGALPPPPGFAAIPFSYGPSADQQDGGAHDAMPGIATQQQQQQQQQQHGRSSAAGYHAVGLSYGAQPASSAPGAGIPQAGLRPASLQGAQLPAPGPDEPAFVPGFLVPEHLKRHLPATERHFKVMQQTSNFVREGGGQLEVLLRVKQAGNPLFGFLLPANPLHAFYRWLVETPPQDRVVIDAAPTPATGGSARRAGRQQQDASVQQPEQPQHPSEQWRVGSAEQPPPWHEPRRPAAEATPASASAPAPVPAVHYGPVQQPPDAHEPLTLLSQYDGDWTGQGKAAAAAQQAQHVRGVQGVGETAAAAAAPGGGQQPPEGLVAQAARAVPASATTADAAVGPSTAERLPSNDDVPPPEMLAVMQKLVAFIQKNGAKFEAMVRAKEAGNPVFAFLLPWSKHHPRYRFMLADAVGTAEADSILAAAARPPVAHANAAAAGGPLPPITTATGTDVVAPKASAAGTEQQEPLARADAAEPPPWARPTTPTPEASSQQQQQEQANPIPGPRKEPTPPMEARQRAAAGAAPGPAAALAATVVAEAGGALSVTLPPWLKEKMVAAAAAAAGTVGAATAKGAATSSGGGGVPAIKLQANPSIAKVALKGNAASAPACGAEGGPRAASPALSGELDAMAEALGEEVGEEGGQSGPAMAAGTARQGVEGAPGDEAALAEQEEQKKAERRRRARELLVQRQQEAVLAVARQRQQQLSAISVHRAAFLAGEEEAPEMAGTLHDAPAKHATQAAAGPLPGCRPPRPGSAPGGDGEDVEEGEIFLAPEPNGQHVGGRPPSRHQPRAPSELLLLEDLVTLRMKRTSSADALVSSAAPGPGQQQRLLPPPGATIAGHRVAFAAEGGRPAGSGSGLGMEAGAAAAGAAGGANSAAAGPQQQGAAGPPKGDAGQGSIEAVLHLRRIRDRIAAMTAGGKPAAAQSAGTGAEASRLGSALGSKPPASPEHAGSAGVGGSDVVRQGRSTSRHSSRSRRRSPSSSSSEGRGGSSNSGGSSRSRSRSLSRSKSPSHPRRHKRHRRDGKKSGERERWRHHSRSRGGEEGADGPEGSERHHRKHRHKHKHGRKHKKARQSERDD